MEEKTRLRDITGLLKVTMMDLELATHIFLAPEHSLPGPLGVSLEDCRVLYGRAYFLSLQKTDPGPWGVLPGRLCFHFQLQMLRSLACSLGLIDWFFSFSLFLPSSWCIFWTLVPPC